MQVVLASNNPGKLTELRPLFEPLGLVLVNQGALGIGEADEPHLTFLENALAKARHAAAASGGAAIADDSGLVVDALDGAPGVDSATFAPLTEAARRAAGNDREALRRARDDANSRLLLQRLQGRPDRAAAYVCTLVALRHADDPEPLVASGRWAATIGHEPHGSGGFGYDAFVYLPSLGRTVAELDAPTKNALSHRARAAAAMRELLREHWLGVR